MENRIFHGADDCFAESTGFSSRRNPIVHRSSPDFANQENCIKKRQEWMMNTNISGGVWGKRSEKCNGQNGIFKEPKLCLLFGRVGFLESGGRGLAMVFERRVKRRNRMEPTLAGNALHAQVPVLR
jgi:hypothetical protein